MIHLLPQLPCNNRYTEDWAGMWSRELINLGMQCEVFGHNLPTEVTRFFTDPDYALRYECDQIRALSQRDYLDTIFCLDIDFPGLLSAAIPVLKLGHPKLKCFGYLHAGSWNNGDIFSGTLGKKHLERAMFDIFDRVFVATEYHKQNIERYLGGSPDTLEVVGFPFYRKDVEYYAKPLPFEEKSGIIVVGRGEQSNKDLLDTVTKKLGTEVSVIEATSRAGYFYQLNKAKVVLSLKTEETFGISQLEAYVLGGIPLSPNAYSYPEVIGDERLLYNDKNDLIDKLAYLLSLKENLFQIDIEKYEHVIETCAISPMHDF